MRWPTLKRPGVVVAVLAVLLVVAALVVWRWRGPEVEAIAVQQNALVRSLQFSARVASQNRVNVGSTITGRVQAVLVDEGAVVRRGDTLLHLEAHELLAAVSQAEATERQAAARLAGVRSTGRASAQAGLNQAQAGVRAAQAEWARTLQLVDQGFLSAARLDEARRARDVAQAQLASAQAQQNASADDGSDLVQAQAQLALAQAAMKAARARLAQAELRAPSDARVLTREVEPGQIVQPGKTLLSLALDGPLQISAQVDERFLEQLRVGQGATVVADAFVAQRIGARVLSIAPAIDAQRGSVEVKLNLLESPPEFLREDMTLSVEVETARRDRSLVLPLSALRAPAPDGVATVLVAVDGRARSRSVTLGLRTLEAAEVLDGLADGDQVLIGVAQVDQRVRVRVLPWQPGQRVSSAKAGDGAAALTNAMGR